MCTTKRFVTFACLLAVVLLAGCGPGAPPTSIPVASQPDTPTTLKATSQNPVLYQDRQGRFSVPVPANWEAEERDGYGLLTSPEDKIKVYVLAVEKSSIEAAVAEAWQKVEPGFNLEQEQVVETPPTRGEEKALDIIYKTGHPPAEVVVGGGWLYQGVAYLVLLRADTVALQQREAQVNIIGTGYNISALTKVDLSAARAVALTPEMLAEVEAYIREAMQRFEVPAAEVAIVQGGRIVYAKGFGLRGPGTDQPVTPETLMMIGSSTKTMTTMMMATIVDEGKMQWDTPAIKILPGFAVKDPEISRKITVRNLVCACTGVPRRDAELIFNANDMTAESVVDSLKTFEFFTGFGEAFQYSNQMVAAGGYVAAAAAAGQTGDLYAAYEQELRRRVIEPIGMLSTTLSLDEVRASSNYATPYGIDLTGRLVPIALENEASEALVAPAGGAWSNAMDIGRYLITLLNQGVAPDGRRVVSQENLNTTFQPQVPVSAETSYGLGWFVDQYKGQPMLQHGGNTLGFTSDLVFLPRAGLGISVLTTGRLTNTFTQAVRFRVLETVFGQPHDADTQAQSAWQQRQKSVRDVLDRLQQGLDREAVERYAGTWTNAALGQIRLYLESGRLLMDTGEFTTELRAMAQDGTTHYVTYDAPFSGSALQFKGDAGGRPIIVLGSGVAEYTFTKAE